MQFIEILAQNFAAHVDSEQTHPSYD